MLPDLSRRVLEPERMDAPGLDKAEHEKALAALGRVNRLSNSTGLLWGPIQRLARQEGLSRVRVLDVACGGGDLAIGLACRAARAKLPLEITGLDISETAIGYARRRAESAGVKGVSFQIADVLSPPLPRGHDVLCCSLFLHHLTNQQAADLLESLAAAAGRMVLVNDLRRSTSGLLLAHLACRLLTTSSIVHYDGPQSIKAAFTLREISDLCRRAGLEDARVESRWASRLRMVWRKPP